MPILESPASLEATSTADPAPAAPELVRPVSNLDLADVALVGGKNASLGELTRGRADAGVPDRDAVLATLERVAATEGRAGSAAASR